MSALTALLGLALLTAPAGPAIEVVTSPGEIYVGDPVGIELRVDVPQGVEPFFPEWQEAWGEAEVREAGPIQTVANDTGGTTVSQHLTIAFFTTGDIVLPPPAITVTAGEPDGRGTKTLATSDPIVVTVASLLPPGEEIPEPQPPAPPVPLQLGKPFLWTVALLALLSLLGLAVLITTRRSEAAGGSLPVDPLTALGSALDGLRSETDLEVAFSALSIHLRRFFGRSLNFRAAESTTTEIRRGLLAKELPTTLIRRTEDLLRQCDGVKFAQQKVERQEVAHGLAEAGAIGSETMSALAPPPPPDESDAAIGTEVAS